MGHEVHTAESGQQALESILLEGMDVLLIDVYLPDTTAMALIPQLRDLYPATRIVALTGHSCRELERRLRALGVSYYIAKPFQKAELERVFDHMASRPGIQAGCRDDNNS